MQGVAFVGYAMNNVRPPEQRSNTVLDLERAVIRAGIYSRTFCHSERSEETMLLCEGSVLQNTGRSHKGCFAMPHPLRVRPGLVARTQRGFAMTNIGGAMMDRGVVVWLKLLIGGKAEMLKSRNSENL